MTKQQVIDLIHDIQNNPIMRIKLQLPTAYTVQILTIVAMLVAKIDEHDAQHNQNEKAQDRILADLRLLFKTNDPEKLAKTDPRFRAALLSFALALPMKGGSK